MIPTCICKINVSKQTGEAFQMTLLEEAWLKLTHVQFNCHHPDSYTPNSEFSGERHTLTNMMFLQQDSAIKRLFDEDVQGSGVERVEGCPSPERNGRLHAGDTPAQSIQ